MQQAVIFIDRLVPPFARRTASADAEGRYPVAVDRRVQTRFRRDVPAINSFFTSRGGSPDAHGRIRAPHWVSGIDPKSLRACGLAISSIPSMPAKASRVGMGRFRRM